MLKERFSTAPVLSMPDMTKPFILEMDTSKWAIGATLLQKQEDGQIHPCGYLSHCYIPDLPWTILGPEPLPKPTHTSKHITSHVFSDTPRT